MILNVLEIDVHDRKIGFSNEERDIEGDLSVFLCNKAEYTMLLTLINCIRDFHGQEEHRAKSFNSFKSLWLYCSCPAKIDLSF